MDSMNQRKIINGKTKKVNIEDIKVGDLVRVCEDCRGNVLIVDNSDVIKKILVNGEESGSALLKKGNSFCVFNIEEYISCFGLVASIEQKPKSVSVTLKFKEKVEGKQEYTFKAKDKIRKIV